MSSWDYQFVCTVVWLISPIRASLSSLSATVRPRIGGRGKLLRLEHIPLSACQTVVPSPGKNDPEGIVVGDFPFPDPEYMERYPMFDPADPFRYPVSARYYNIYSFCKDFVSTPRFLGAFDWLEIAGTLAPLLHNYNLNSSALSLHMNLHKGIGTRRRNV